MGWAVTSEAELGLEADSGFVRGRKKSFLGRYVDVYDATTAPEANAVT